MADAARYSMFAQVGLLLNFCDPLRTLFSKKSSILNSLYSGTPLISIANERTLFTAHCKTEFKTGADISPA
jgi:hypothetical protein